MTLLSVVRLLSAAMLAMLGGELPAVAQTENATVIDGIRAFEDAEFDQAIEILTVHAKRGDAHAQFYLGSLYEFAGYTGRKPGRAIYWFRQAAQQGDDQALVAANRRGLEIGIGPALIAASLEHLVELGNTEAAYVTVSALLPDRHDPSLESFETRDDVFTKALARLDSSPEAAALSGRYYANAFYHYEADRGSGRIGSDRANGA